jgi:hypothetical protein
MSYKSTQSAYLRAPPAYSNRSTISLIVQTCRVIPASIAGVTRSVLRIELPSTSAAMTWTRLAVLSWFMLDFLLDRLGITMALCRGIQWISFILPMSMIYEYP